ncbi:F-box protein [Corchorus olitorius]|uniref:F-box protein n=1 Tax=Corchorus olitorius TaxID=93759 RepID=A0A1R3JPR2_9ROSI|nr:F-box protein [Corchorus olitorius]
MLLPQSVIFGLRIEGGKISIYVCFPGDIAWKTHDFVFDRVDSTAEHVSYAGGIFYCVFSGGELGAFNLQLKEWTILSLEMLPGFDFQYARLIASDGDLRLMGSEYSEDLKLLKFDFYDKRWVKEDSLNNRVLFISDMFFLSSSGGNKSISKPPVLSGGLSQ